jgi:hypothetical protein
MTLVEKSHRFDDNCHFPIAALIFIIKPVRPSKRRALIRRFSSITSPGDWARCQEETGEQCSNSP